MTDLTAAEQFVLANARLIDRHRLAVLLHGAPADQVVDALVAYRTSDGGFGHALEPDVRCPGSQTSAVLHALDVLAAVDALDHPLVGEIGDWLTTITNPDGGVPTVLPSADGFPRAPWMVPAPDSGFLTYAIAGKLWQAGSTHPWLPKATEWCWTALEQADGVGGYTVKFALDFLDAVPDPARAAAAIERFRPALDGTGSLAVEGGTENEKITPITLSPHPGTPSRALFTADQLDADLDRLAAGQHDDGGWDVDYLHWSPGQALDWRGIATVQALTTLQANKHL
ncbi:hypothetical protein [Kribbella sp. NPDC051770]|uniref:hypothetical protein n=1 Tax=Kribbella sp. NPDC051770 TaxID=3155413 RepID=UPI00343CFCE9